MKSIVRILGGILAAVVAAAVVGVVVLKSMDFNEYRGLIAEQVKAATGRDLTIAGRLKLEISLSPSLAVEDVRLANAPWGSRRDMIVLKRLAAEVRFLPLLRGKVEIDRLVLSGLDIALEVDGQGRTNWDMTGAGAPKGRAPAEPAGIVPRIGRVALRDLKVSYRNARDGVSFQAAVQSFTLGAKDMESPMDVVLKASFADTPVNASGRIGAFKTIVEGGRLPVRLDVDAAGIKMRAEGHIEDSRALKGVDVGIGIKAERLAATTAALGAAVPALKDWNAPAIPADVSFRLKGQGTTFAADNLKVHVGRSDLSGSLHATFKGGKPEISGSLASARLDLNEIFPAGSPAAARQKGDGRVFSADPLPVDALRAVNADLIAKIRTAVLPGGGVVVQDVNGRVTLKEGRLAVPVTFSAGGGSIKGDVSIDGARTPAAVALRLDGADVDWGRVLEDSGVIEAVRDSKAEVAVTLSGAGRSAREIMGTLSGEARIVLGPGRIHNKMLDVAGGDVVGQVLGAINPFARSDEFTALNCAVARFAVREGIADGRDALALETGKMTVAGSGRLDLRSETLDFAFKPEARQGVGLGNVVGMVRITGTLAQPNVGVDPLETIKSAIDTGAKIATLGLSETAKSLFLGRPGGTASPCQAALGRRDSTQPAPVQTQPRAQPRPAQPALGKKQGEGIEDKMRGIGEGITKGLRGILGQ